MKKFNKLVSAAVATAMVMGTVVPAMAGDSTFVPTKDGTYTTDSVVAYQFYPALTGTITNSMCNGVFAAEADVTINGDWATLELYLCNPTPSWGGLDVGLLSQAYITYDGVQYEGTLTTIGQVDGAVNPDAAVKVFGQESTFFGIEIGESYTCDTMEFTIPKAALAGGTAVDDAGTLEHEWIQISAWVNLMMNSRQSFFLDLNYVDAPEVSSQTMEISATVPANVSTYEVSIPESADMGDLSKEENTAVTYEVEVDAENLDKTITVETDGSVILTNGAGKSLTLTNDFGTEGTETFDETGSATGTLTAAAADVAAIAGEDAVNLTGSITFTITAK